MSRSAEKYTLVAHTGLPRAVELRLVSTVRQQQAVVRLGGFLFFTYAQAAEAEHAINYPSPERDVEKTGDPGWLHPGVRGRFSKKKVNGERVYIPTEQDRKDLGVTS